MALVYGACERSGGHEDGALIDGMIALMRESPQGSQIPSALWGKKQSLQCGRHSSLNPAYTWISESQPPRQWGIDFCSL